MKKIIFALWISLLVPFGAAQAADYSIGPLIIEHDVEPRESFEETIKITNTTNRPLRLFPTVNAVTLGTEGAISAFVPASMGDNTTSITSWIAVSRARLEIAPGESVKIPVTISINPNAAPGEYHAFIGFAEGSNRDEAEALVLAGTAPGTIVRLSLVEKRTEYLRLDRFSIDRFITHKDEAVVNYILQNIGGLPLTPTGEIIFYNGNGVELASAPVNSAGTTIAPGATQSFTVEIPAVGAIGRHKALLNVEYGTVQRANLYDTTYFNIVPIQWLITLFFVLLVTSGGLALYYTRSKTSFQDEDTAVAMYVRSGITGTEKDHDINLKK